MLLVSTIQTIGDILTLFPNTKVLNLSSFNEQFPRVGLMPPPGLNCLDDDNFDNDFFNYIFNNDYVFLELMKIIMPLYYGDDVCILVTHNDVLDTITESILKIILGRYGYIANIINESSDVSELYTNMTNDEGFSMTGLSCLDKDKERYSYLSVYIEYKNTGDIRI